MTEEDNFAKLAHSLWVVTEAMWELDEMETLTDSILTDLTNTAMELATYMMLIDPELTQHIVSEMNEEFAPQKEARLQRTVNYGLQEIEGFLEEVDGQ